MKRLELDIKCCKDCPCLRWRYGLQRYTCIRSDAIIFVRDFLISIQIHIDCPLSDIPVKTTNTALPEHHCRDHKKYATGGCTCCWSCNICGQFGGCDNNISGNNWKV